MGRTDITLFAFDNIAWIFPEWEVDEIFGIARDPLPVLHQRKPLADLIMTA